MCNVILCNVSDTEHLCKLLSIGASMLSSVRIVQFNMTNYYDKKAMYPLYTGPPKAEHMADVVAAFLKGPFINFVHKNQWRTCCECEQMVQRTFNDYPDELRHDVATYQFRANLIFVLSFQT